MTTFYPVCVTFSLFAALVLFDIMEQRPENINKHTLEGFVVLALMLYLSFKDMEIVSWGLLLIPLVVLITCYFLGRTVKTSTSTAVPAAQSSAATNAAPAQTVSTPVCPTGATTASSISTPISTSMSASVSGIANTYTPTTSCSMA